MKTFLPVILILGFSSFACWAQRETFRREIPPPPTESQILLALVEKGEIALSNEIFFQFDSTEFAAESAEKQLSSIARVLRDPRLEGKRFIVEGHTCDLGQVDYNQELSEKRAARVVQYFEQQGVSNDRLESVGFGETRPLAEHTVQSDDDKDEVEFKRRMNRRVVIRKLKD